MSISTSVTWNTEIERVEETVKGGYKINGCTAVTHSCFALPRDSTGRVW